MGQTSFPHPYYFSRKKRAFDVILSVLLVIILSPFIIFIAILIKLTSKGPVIFRQERTGQNGKTFTIYKFRTMYLGADKDQDKFKKLNTSPFPTFKIPNDPRFTVLGRHLSKYGLDEIPQLVNILKGQMSLVGPRPFPIIEATKIPASWKFRFLARPGLISSRYRIIADKLTQKLWEKSDYIDLQSSGLTQDICLLMVPFKYFVLSMLGKLDIYNKTNDSSKN